MKREERRLTVMVIPDEASGSPSRSYEIGYRRLRLLLVAAGVVLLLGIGMAVSWVFVASQAARVPGLRRQVDRLEAEQGRVAELAAALAELENRYNQVRRMLGADQPDQAGSIWLPAAGEPEVDREAGESSLPSAWPLTQRGFVTREHLGQIPGQHPGIDIAVPEGTYVRASGAGQVLAAGEDSIYGKFVRIRHAQGWVSVYGHAAELFVEPGDRVEAHEVIALSGNTGRSTAPHLHFEIWHDSASVDPRTRVRQP